MKFPFPIGLLLFNSPDYSEKVLSSLNKQSLEVEESRLVVLIDGFEGSKPQNLGHVNQTGLIEDLAKDYFPKAKIVRFRENQGIGKQYLNLSRLVFDFTNSDWGLFCEHDFILGDNYLETILYLIQQVENYSEIVQVDATGDSLLETSRGKKNYYLPIHDWAYALRKKHYEERSAILKEYEVLLDRKIDISLGSKHVNQTLQEFEVYPLGSMIDYVNQAIRIKFKKMAVTTGEHFGVYIGREGENFTNSIYENMGYADWEISATKVSDYPEFTEEIIFSLRSEEALGILKSANSIINFFETEYHRIVKKFSEINLSYSDELEFLHEELAKSIQANLKILNSRPYQVISILNLLFRKINIFK